MDLPAPLQPLSPYLAYLRAAAQAIGILIGGWILSRIAFRLTTRALSGRRFDLMLARFLASIVRYLVLAAAITASLDAVGVHTTSLVAILASAGLAVGLALQGSLSNFASGVLILFFRYFQLGDKVTVADKTGIVEDIGLFTTVMISSDNEKIIIPNASVTSGTIVNMSDRGLLRGAIKLTVEGRLQDLPRMLETLKKAAARTEGVSKERPPETWLTDMEDGSFDLTLTVFYKAVEEDAVMHALRVAALEGLDAASLKLQNRTQIILHPRGTIKG